MAASPETVATPINTYSQFYDETDWTARSVHAARIMREFNVPTEGVYKTGPQLHDDTKATWNEMPHAYVTGPRKGRQENRIPPPCNST
jgi:hypothetical protein